MGWRHDRIIPVHEIFSTHEINHFDTLIASGGTMKLGELARLRASPLSMPIKVAAHDLAAKLDDFRECQKALCC